MERFDDVLPPSWIGRYQVLERIGAGGMAEAFLALRHGMGGFAKPVAIKRILPSLAGDATFREMMHREAAVAALLNHPNIVSVLELDEVDGQLLIAMEMLFGSDAEQLGHAGPIAGALAARITMDAARGLHHAHELRDEHGRPMGIVHRDVSPSNLFITEQGITKVLDFGIASAPDVFDGETRTGALKGKVYFMAPEQASQRALDARTDVFALGMSMWAMVVGRPPFDGDPLSVLERIRVSAIPSPLELGVDIDPELSAALMRSLRHDPSMRYASAAEFADALSRFAADPSSIATLLERVSGRHVSALRDRVRQATRARDRLNSDLPTSRVSSQAPPSGASFEDTVAARPESVKPEPETAPGRRASPRSAVKERSPSPRVTPSHRSASFRPSARSAAPSRLPEVLALVIGFALGAVLFFLIWPL